jgi:hypothetical protein
MINNFSKTTIIGLSAIIFIMIVVNVVLSAELSHVGLRLNESERKAQALEESVAKIDQSLALNNSLTSLLSQALLMGYTKEVSFIHITKPNMASLNSSVVR